MTRNQFLVGYLDGDDPAIIIRGLIRIGKRHHNNVHAGIGLFYLPYYPFQTTYLGETVRPVDPIVDRRLEEQQVDPAGVQEILLHPKGVWKTPQGRDAGRDETKIRSGEP